jgi:choline monooxygenase
LFVRASNDGPSLQEWLGELFTRIEGWTSLPDWKPTVNRTLPMPANWKIPVEVPLESYHIPEVHPQSFGEDPGASKSEHAFAKFSSSFFTSFNTPRLIDKILKLYESFNMKVLGTPFSAKYEHHHIFPNLLISHTPSLTLVQIVRPLTGTTCVSEVWQYSCQSARRNPISKLTAWLWGRFTGWLSYQILQNNIRIFSHVQGGEQAATDRAILGRCEERLYSFEKFFHDQIETTK